MHNYIQLTNDVCNKQNIFPEIFIAYDGKIDYNIGIIDWDLGDCYANKIIDTLFFHCNFLCIITTYNNRIDVIEYAESKNIQVFGKPIEVESFEKIIEYGILVNKEIRR